MYADGKQVILFKSYDLDSRQLAVLIQWATRSTQFIAKKFLIYILITFFEYRRANQIDLHRNFFFSKQNRNFYEIQIILLSAIQRW
jgi:hypothetical protein